MHLLCPVFQQSLGGVSKRKTGSSPVLIVFRAFLGNKDNAADLNKGQSSHLQGCPILPRLACDHFAKG